MATSSRWPGLARAGQGDDLVAAKLGHLPGFDVPVAFGQLEAFAVLQLGQALALAVIECGSPQRGIAVEFVEQLLGIFGRVQRLDRQGRIGHQAANGLQRLGRHAFLGDPVGRADKGQVGDQQNGGQQDKQGGQELLAHWQVFEALAQWHRLYRWK